MNFVTKKEGHGGIKLLIGSYSSLFDRILRNFPNIFSIFPLFHCDENTLKNTSRESQNSTFLRKQKKQKWIQLLFDICK